MKKKEKLKNVMFSGFNTPFIPIDGTLYAVDHSTGCGCSGTDTGGTSSWQGTYNPQTMQTSDSFNCGSTGKSPWNLYVGYGGQNCDLGSAIRVGEKALGLP